MRPYGVLLVFLTVVVSLAMANTTLGLDIQLSPRTLVLSSGGDQLTIHTDFPYRAVAGVRLDVGAVSGVDVRTWADDCGNLVVRCSKQAVEDAVGCFRGRFTYIDVTLTVDTAVSSVSDTKDLRVRK